MRYGLPMPEIVHKYIAGETIVLNLKNGAYYSLPAAAAIVWELLLQGCAAERVAQALASSESKIAPSLTLRFISGLCEEGLLAPNDGLPVSDAEFVKLFAPLAEEAGTAVWPAPAFEKFTDMQAFLLMDPIHEVGEQGWPFPRADA
jgi:coenzyme PQQ synthesis protein D (PqqD)